MTSREDDIRRGITSGTGVQRSTGHTTLPPNISKDPGTHGQRPHLCGCGLNQ
jgi:hypothetical protein